MKLVRCMLEEDAMTFHASERRSVGDKLGLSALIFHEQKRLKRYKTMVLIIYLNLIGCLAIYATNGATKNV